MSAFFTGMAMSGLACAAAMVGVDCLRRHKYLLAAANLTMALVLAVTIGVAGGMEIAGQ